MCLKDLICQEELFRFIYKLYISYMKLHYIVFYYLPRLDIVEKKIKKISKKSKALIKTCFGTRMNILRENVSRRIPILFLLLTYNIK